MELMATLQFSPGSSPGNIQDQIQANRAWNSRRRRLRFQNRNPLTITIHFRTRTKTRRRWWMITLSPSLMRPPSLVLHQSKPTTFFYFVSPKSLNLSLSLSSLSLCLCLSVCVYLFFSLRPVRLRGSEFGPYMDCLWNLR